MDKESEKDSLLKQNNLNDFSAVHANIQHDNTFDDSFITELDKVLEKQEKQSDKKESIEVSNKKTCKRLIRRLLEVLLIFIISYYLGTINQKQQECPQQLCPSVEPASCKIVVDYKELFNEINKKEKKLQLTPNDLSLKERLCLLYKKTYNKQKALECYVDLLNSGLNTKSVNKHLGDLYLDLEKYQDALDHYIKIDTEDIKNLKMLHNLVKIYDKLKNKKELINTYGFIVELDPSNLKALFNLIRLNLNAQNKFPAAKALYQYLLQKQFDFKEYQELIKKFKGLKKMLPEMIFDNFDNFKDANKVTLFNFARILLANNLPTKSRIVFKTIFGDQDTEDKLKAAALYKEFNFLEEAVKLYEGILEKEPENTDVLFELAYLNYCINNTESALAYADKLYEIDSDNLEVLMVMGEILTQKGSYQEAFDVVNKAESIDLLRKDIMRLKLKIMKKLKKNRPELAKDIKEYEKAVKNKTNKHDKEDVNSQCKKQKSWYDFN